MRFILAIAVVAWFLPIAFAICPDGWVGVGVSELCGIGSPPPGYGVIISGAKREEEKRDCGGTFGAIFQNNCDIISMNDNGNGDYCADRYIDGAAVACMDGPMSQPYFITTSGGYFGGCVKSEENCDYSIGISAEYNPIYWCCSRS